MNRDDLLKRCVDRRVAHETSVVAVSHLFYVYLLSALKKGQRVEVPNFGTFGTRIVGVKRQRRLPFFEVENELADKVNERYRDLTPRVVAKYELIPFEDDIEYEGKEPPYDPVAKGFGKEILFDTYRDLTAEEFRHEERSKVSNPGPSTFSMIPSVPTGVEPPAASLGDTVATDYASPSKEKNLMPKLNLREEGMETPPPVTDSEAEPLRPYIEPPTLREYSTPGGPSPIVQIILVLLAIAALTFALNYFGIVHFWGKNSTAQIGESVPPILESSPTESSTTQTETPSGTSQPSPAAKTPVQPPGAIPERVNGQAGSGTFRFTIQVTSQNSRREANRVVDRLTTSGLDAHISEAFVKGRNWFRVRVGRYATLEEARNAAAKLSDAGEVGVWVAKLDQGE